MTHRSALLHVRPRSWDDCSMPDAGKLTASPSEPLLLSHKEYEKELLRLQTELRGDAGVDRGEGQTAGRPVRGA